MFLEIEVLNSYVGSSRLCVIIFAYRIVKCLSGKTFRAIWRKKLSVPEEPHVDLLTLIYTELTVILAYTNS
ncbi:MAG: hypothetical protein EWV67_14840 [Microcystis sp. M_QC_C_20170808_M2Col]|nr:MAG: hypothetical protein EWV67_14840 [Microcystis sp. M_QC_C_20170808_M2Col]TRT64334.1 MAG: hypothetical protein EWV68_19795 [Microcystis sp. M_QC_C_20170808_M9Col]